MARKSDLRKQRTGTVINQTSKKQEASLADVIGKIKGRLEAEFPGIKLMVKKQWFLKDIVCSLRLSYPDVDFIHYHNTTFMRPDGGIMMLQKNDGMLCPILISERKNQGTNDLRALEGKPRQAKGNAIERLGKNVIGFRTALLPEAIFPFVCFGDGCDFAEDSTICDRVVTIAMFGSLNKTYLHVQGDKFNRGSFYFRVQQWTVNEMFEIAYEIAECSIYYYFSKYGKSNFLRGAVE